MDIELKHSGAKKPATTRPTRTPKVKNLQLEVEQIMSHTDPDASSQETEAMSDCIEARFVLESLVTPLRQQQSLPMLTPSKSEMKLAMTPRRSCRKSVKPVQDYDDIVAKRCLRSKKKHQDLDDGEDNSVVEHKWTPAKVGRVSQKRARKSRKASAAVKARKSKMHMRNDSSEENKENFDGDDDNEAGSEETKHGEEEDKVEEVQGLEEMLMQKAEEQKAEVEKEQATEQPEVEQQCGEEQKAGKAVEKENAAMQKKLEEESRVLIEDVEEDMDKPMIDYIEADAMADPINAIHDADNSAQFNELMVTQVYELRVLQTLTKTVKVPNDGHKSGHLTQIEDKVDKANKEGNCAGTCTSTNADAYSDMGLSALQPEQVNQLVAKRDEIVKEKPRTETVEPTNTTCNLDTIEIPATPEEKATTSEKSPEERTLNETFDTSDCMIISPTATADDDVIMPSLRVSVDENDTIFGPHFVLTATAPLTTSPRKTPRKAVTLAKKSPSKKKTPFKGKARKSMTHTPAKTGTTPSMKVNTPFTMRANSLLAGNTPARVGAATALATATIVAAQTKAIAATAHAGVALAKSTELPAKSVATPAKKPVANDNSGVLLARSALDKAVFAATSKRSRPTPTKKTFDNKFNPFKINSPTSKNITLSAKKATPIKRKTFEQTVKTPSNIVPHVVLFNADELLQAHPKGPTHSISTTPKKRPKAYRFPTPHKQKDTYSFPEEVLDNNQTSVAPLSPQTQKPQSIMKYKITNMDASLYIANSIRKRSLSVCIDGNDGDRINRTRVANRVKFHSPANETTLIEDLDVIMAKNAAINKDLFVTQRRKRSMSFDESIISQKSKLPRPVVVDMKGVNPNKSQAATTTTPQRGMPMRTKLPNFAAIHKKQFDKMENLIEHVQRKNERAKVLTSSATKAVRPGSTSKNEQENTSQGNLTAGSTAATGEKPTAAKKINLEANTTELPKTTEQVVPATAADREKHSRLPIASKTEQVVAAKKLPHPTLFLKRPLKPTQLDQPSSNVIKAPLPLMAHSSTAADVKKSQRIGLQHNVAVDNAIADDENAVVASGSSTSLQNKLDTRRQRHMDMFKNRGAGAARAAGGAAGAQNFGDIIRGVRSNRRFNLQMQHRMHLEQNQP